MAAVTVGTREQILSRVLAILEGMSGAPPVFRNRRDVEDISRPAIVLLDGVEHNIAEQRSTPSRLRPAIIRMSPQIFVLLKERDTVMNDTVDNVLDPVGAEISYWIDMIRAALSNDAQLLMLLTANGRVEYQGCWSDLQTGSTISGELRLFIDMVYMWLPPQ